MIRWIYTLPGLEPNTTHPFNLTPTDTTHARPIKPPHYAFPNITFHVVCNSFM